MNITTLNNFTYIVCLYAGANSYSSGTHILLSFAGTNSSENERSSHAMIPVYQNGANPYARDWSGTRR